MGIKLARSARPEAVAVELKGDAVWRLRPASTLDVEMARAEAVRLFAGVLTGSQALAALSQTFGDLFGLGEGTDDARREAATQLLAEVTLALACSEGWQGVFDADGAHIPEPHAGAVALLMSDPVEAQKVRRVLNIGPARGARRKKRISRLAAWRGGGGERTCADCRATGEACAFGLRAGGRFCPEVEFTPHTAEGRLVLAALDRCGVWRFAAFTGALIGIDLAEAIASLPEGIDRERARALLIAAETAFVRALQKRKDSEHA